MKDSRRADEVPLPGGDFQLFLTRLGYQAMMSCGLIENPVTGSKDVHVGNARMLLDDLLMLREKTAGNLTETEAAKIEEVCRQLGPVVEKLERGETGEEGQ